MQLARLVEPELLDGLPEHDPAAQRARRDLQRVHRVMGTRAILLKAWRALLPQTTSDAAAEPLNVLELGAGDGSLLLGVAQSLHTAGQVEAQSSVRANAQPAVHADIHHALKGDSQPVTSADLPTVRLTLLDRQRLLTPALVAGYAACSWQVHAQAADVLDWASAAPDVALLPPDAPRWDLIVANLFLHHFEPAALARLLAAIAARSDRVLVCEPRRSRFALAGSHLIGALGVNAVTREDAVASVRAGFTGNELATLWPADAPGWSLREQAAGLFSHCLLGTRTLSAA